MWVGSFLNESSLSPDWADTPQPPFTQLATPKYLPRHSKSSYIYIYVDTSLGLCPKKYCASISSTYPVGRLVILGVRNGGLHGDMVIPPCETNMI